MITLEQFAQAIPCTLDVAKVWHPLVVAAMARRNIDTLPRVAGFLAQMSVECAKFTRFTENLNYSVNGLAATWPRHFAVNGKPNGLAWKVGRTATQPCDVSTLCDIVYGGRFGNRPYTSDAYKYRGRGPKQITFRANYEECGNALGIDLLDKPELLLEPKWGAESAAWYWQSRHCNEKMDAGDFEGVTRAINGGLNGFEDRKTALALAKKVLGI